MRPRKYASEAEKQAAYRARRVANVTGNVTAVPNVTVEAQVGTVKPDEAVSEAKTEQWRLDAKAYMATGKLPKVQVPTPGFVRFKDCPEVPHGPKDVPWLGAGRGVVREFRGKRYVLVARGAVDFEAMEHGVVTEADFVARLDQRCEHKRLGWACHAC